jgi:hypothetical protein
VGRREVAGILRVDSGAVGQQSSLQSLSFDDALCLATLFSDLLAHVLLLYGTVVTRLAHAESHAAETLGCFYCLAGKNRHTLWSHPREHIVEDSTLVDLSCFKAIVDSLVSFGNLIEDILDDGVSLLSSLEVLPVDGIAVVVELQCACVLHGLFRDSQGILDCALADTRERTRELLGEVRVLELAALLIGLLDLDVVDRPVRNQVPVVIHGNAVGLLDVQLLVQLPEIVHVIEPDGIDVHLIVVVGWVRVLDDKLLVHDETDSTFGFHLVHKVCLLVHNRLIFAQKVAICAEVLIVFRWGQQPPLHFLQLESGLQALFALDLRRAWVHTAVIELQHTLIDAIRVLLVLNHEHACHQCVLLCAFLYVHFRPFDTPLTEHVS